MKTAPGIIPPRPAASRELAAVRARLADSEETIHAIRRGEVDALLGQGKQGSQVFTLAGADHPYRVLIESMNDGALTMTADKMILYSNRCFARMVRCPLEQVTGSSFRRFLSADDLATLKPLLKRADNSAANIPVLLRLDHGASIPVQISVRPLGKNHLDRATIGLIVTDLTEARRTEEMLRALTRSVLHAQEAERGRVALELHDNISQLLIAVLFRSQVLADSLAGSAGPTQSNAIRLRVMLRNAVEEVQRIARNLRPSILDELGLAAILRATCTEFAERAHVAVSVGDAELTARLPADCELALYRILQEALQNVARHARARRVTVKLTETDAWAQLAITDDGVGFDPAGRPARGKGIAYLGLLGMRERARSVGGSFTLRSSPGAGTEIAVRIPVLARAAPPVG